jgi:hypothetical protein
MKKIIILLTVFLLSTYSIYSQTWNIGYPVETDVTATLNGNTLTISGTGKMKDWDNFDSPWSSGLSIEMVIVQNGVTSIGNYAFSGCGSLTSVTIGSSVTSIGSGAFYSCSSLISATIPNSVTSIGSEAFSNCRMLASIIIPNSVIFVGDNAFYYCRSLALVTIGNSVTSIGKVAFGSCHDLTSVTIPNSVVTIGEKAFSDCGLTLATIGNGTTSIGEGAFSLCEDLILVTIGNSVTSIGGGAFYGCESLREIHNRSVIPQIISSYVFEGVDKSTCTLYVPESSVAAYKSAPVWVSFFNIVGENIAGVENMQTNEKIILYPNPTTGVLYIKTALENPKVIVYDVMGHIVERPRNTKTVNLSNYPNGTYLVAVNGKPTKVIKK